MVACSSHNAIAGYIMHVHFGDPTEAKGIKSASQISQAPIGATIGSEVTANFLLEITGDSTLYFYRFSARFNSDKLAFDSRSEDPRPENWVAADGIDPLESDPDPVSQSAQDPLAGPFLELRRFDGLSEDVDDDLGVGFYKLGSVTFILREIPLAGELLIQPGRFELVDVYDDQGQIDDTLVDTFLQDVDGTPTVADVTFRQGIIAVPEPSSLLLLSLGACGMLGLTKLRTRGRMREMNSLKVK